MPLRSKRGAGTGSGLPEILAGDGGRVLVVKADESGVEWIDPPSGGGGDGVSLGMVIALGGD